MLTDLIPVPPLLPASSEVLPTYLADDALMVQTFLAGLANASVNTELAYRKELGRFLTWALSQGHPPGQCLARINRQDIEAYLRFLRSAAPLPKAGPIKNRNNERMAFWKAPRPLAEVSVAHAATLLRTFFEALTDYEAGPGVPVRSTNPVKSKRVRNTRKSERMPGERVASQNGAGSLERILTLDDMSLVFETIEGLQESHPRHYHRCRWVLHLAYRSFLRISEVAQLQMGDFERDQDGWQMYIHAGKGTTDSTWIRASARLIEELVVYRRSRGIFAYPLPREGNPAVFALPRKGREHPVSAPVRVALRDRFGEPTGAIREEVPPRVERALSERALFAVIKQVFRMAAGRSLDSTQKERLFAASPHWLRHTGITHSRNAGVSLRSLKAQARHKSELATARYEHGSDTELAKEMEKLG
ncbi:MAG: site-specific integrase [Sterolibacterium sp.]|nr:site-specific integrase [Sterolibacterium sp.]